jgi:lipoprotein signal peptidase
MAFLVMLVDQATKTLIVSNLHLHEIRPVLHGSCFWVYVRV